MTQDTSTLIVPVMHVRLAHLGLVLPRRITLDQAILLNVQASDIVNIKLIELSTPTGWSFLPNAYVHNMQQVSVVFVIVIAIAIVI